MGIRYVAMDKLANLLTEALLCSPAFLTNYQNLNLVSTQSQPTATVYTRNASALVCQIIHRESTPIPFPILDAIFKYARIYTDLRRPILRNLVALCSTSPSNWALLSKSGLLASDYDVQSLITVMMDGEVPSTDFSRQVEKLLLKLCKPRVLELDVPSPVEVVVERALEPLREGSTIWSGRLRRIFRKLGLDNLGCVSDDLWAQMWLLAGTELKEFEQRTQVVMLAGNESLARRTLILGKSASTGIIEEEADEIAREIKSMTESRRGRETQRLVKDWMQRGEYYRAAIAYYAAPDLLSDVVVDGGLGFGKAVFRVKRRIWSEVDFRLDDMLCRLLSSVEGLNEHFGKLGQNLDGFQKSLTRLVTTHPWIVAKRARCFLDTVEVLVKHGGSNRPDCLHALYLLLDALHTLPNECLLGAKQHITSIISKVVEVLVAGGRKENGVPEKFTQVALILFKLMWPAMEDVDGVTWSNLRAMRDAPFTARSIRRHSGLLLSKRADLGYK